MQVLINAIEQRYLAHTARVGPTEFSVQFDTHSVTVDGCVGPVSALWALEGMGVTVPPYRHSLAQGTSGVEASTSHHPFSDPGNKKRKI